MRKKIRFITLSFLIILIILLLVLLIGDFSIFSKQKDLDINSGDVRLQTYLFSFLIKEEIQQTPFSREIRRLRIPVGENRIWERVATKIVSTNVLTKKYIDYLYGDTFAECIILVDILDSTNKSEQERIAILQKVLTALSTGKHKEIEGLVRALQVEYNKEKAGGPNLK